MVKAQDVFEGDEDECECIIVAVFPTGKLQAGQTFACMQNYYGGQGQGGIKCGTCSYPELTEDHVLTSAYVKIFRTVTRNAVNEGV